MANESGETSELSQNLNAWFCHIGSFHSYLTQVLESMVIYGYFKPRARRVWAEGLKILADLGAGLLKTKGTKTEALFYSTELAKVSELIRDLRHNYKFVTDLSDDVFRKWVGTIYDPLHNVSQS